MGRSGVGRDRAGKREEGRKGVGRLGWRTHSYHQCINLIIINLSVCVYSSYTLSLCS